LWKKGDQAMRFNEQEIKFLKLIAKCFKENKRVIRDEVIKELRIDDDTYEVLVQEMLNEVAVEKVDNMRAKKYAELKPLARAVELVREIEAPVDIVEKWNKKIRQNPRTAWIVIILLVLVLFIALVNQAWELIARIVKVFLGRSE